MKIGPYHENRALSRPAGQPPKAPKDSPPEKSREQTAPVSPGGGQSRPSQDIVQLSGAEGAHRLELYSRPRHDIVRAADDDTASQPIDKEKLERVRQRIESGYYDRPEVRGKTAERLADELTEPEREQGEPEDDYGIGDD